LHWSDYSTLDLISYLARRRHPAKLMLIGTYRPVDVIISGHPLKAVKRELLARQQCEELPLEYLSEEAVGKYLSVRFPANRFPAKLAALIHERTEGNPLFMTNAVDYLLADQSIVADKGLWQLVAAIEKVDVGVPDSIRQMIEKQVDHLDAIRQRTLEVASVVGAEFSTLALAAGLEEDRAEVEARCHELARQRQFIQESRVQVLPNGEAVNRYGFTHRDAFIFTGESANMWKRSMANGQGKSQRNSQCTSNAGRISCRPQNIFSTLQTTKFAGLRIRGRSDWHAGDWSCSERRQILGSAPGSNWGCS
jgi:predicted ATPase